MMSFTQVLARQPEGTSTGRTRPHWARCPPCWAPVYCHVAPGWLDQQRRRYPKHTGARGHVIFWWPASTTKIPAAGAYIGDGMPPKLAAGIRRWDFVKGGIAAGETEGDWPRRSRQTSLRGCSAAAPVWRCWPLLNPIPYQN